MPNINALLINKTTNVYYSSMVVTLWVCQSVWSLCQVSLTKTWHLTPPSCFTPMCVCVHVVRCQCCLAFCYGWTKAPSQTSVTQPLSYDFQQDSCQSSQFTKWISASKGVFIQLFTPKIHCPSRFPCLLFTIYADVSEVQWINLSEDFLEEILFATCPESKSSGE